MPGNEQESITCPNCGRGKNLSLHISTDVTVRVPVEKGLAVIASEILSKPRPASRENLLIKYSDVNEETRVSIYLDEAEIQIHCPICKAMFTMPKGIKIKCNDVK